MRRRARKIPAEDQWLVRELSDKDIILFLEQYPKVQNYITQFCYGNNLIREYKRFLMWADSGGLSLMGGKPDTVESKHFGSKTFWKYNFTNGIGWAAVFQFLWHLNIKLGR